jgi:beta-mannosidase
VAISLDPTRRATHGSPVTWADRHGPYCFYLSTVGPGKAAFPCYEQAAYDAYNNVSQTIMNQEGPNNPMEWDEYGAAGSSSVYTISKVLSAADRFPVNASESFIFHRSFDAVGAGTMWSQQDAYLPLFGKSESLQAEVRVSQWTQNEGLRYANQAHRRHMPHRSMCSFWTLNEPWPNTAYGSVMDWYGVHKHAFYAATQAAYAPIDISLQYSSLFLVLGEPLPRITAHVVADFAPSIIDDGELTLKVSTLAGKLLHTQYWRNISISVEQGAIGAVVDLPGAVSMQLIPAALAGDVAIFSLALTERGSLKARRQVYTFGLLEPGSNVHDKMDARQPMRPLLHAPPARCKVTSQLIGQNKHSSRFLGELQVVNTGVAPCLYMRMELQDSTLPADSELFHPVEFNDNYITLLAGQSSAVRFSWLPPCRLAATQVGQPSSRWASTKCSAADGTAAPALQLCWEGWNVARSCRPIGASDDDDDDDDDDDVAAGGGGRSR